MIEINKGMSEFPGRNFHRATDKIKGERLYFRTCTRTIIFVVVLVVFQRVFVEVMLFKTFKNKAPLKCTHYTVLEKQV